jgi:hypothetical protein
MHVPILAKSACYLSRVRLFVGMYHFSCHGISVKLWYWGNSVKKTKCWLKWGKNMGHFTWRPKYVSLFLATLNHHKSALWLKWCQAVMASICQHVSVPLPLHRLTWNFMLVASVKICVGKFQIWLKSGTLCEDLNMFFVSDDIILP